MLTPDQFRVTNKQPTPHVEDAPVINHRHLRFLPKAGSPRGHTVRHLMDVSSLSCRILFQSVSASLQNGIRFFHPPKPAYLSARLTARFPVPHPPGTGDSRGFHVPHKYHCKQLRFCPSTGGATSTKEDVRTSFPDHVPFGNLLVDGSAAVHMIVNPIALSWLPTTLDAGRVELASRFALQEPSKNQSPSGFITRRFIPNGAVPRNAWPCWIPVVEHRVVY